MQQTIQAQSNPYSAPVTSAAVGSDNAQLSLTQILFSFKGRIPRRVYWSAALATSFAMVMVMTLASIAGERGAEAVTGLTLLVTYPVFLWSSLAIQAKRWHDRGKSAWMVLISFIPIVGPIWAFVECGCLRGTQGPNQFGTDPT